MECCKIFGHGYPKNSHVTFGFWVVKALLKVNFRKNLFNFLSLGNRSWVDFWKLKEILSSSKLGTSITLFCLDQQNNILTAIKILDIYWPKWRTRFLEHN